MEKFKKDKEMPKVINDLSIVFCGEAGQGIQTIEYALTHILQNAGYNCFATEEFMSRIRGGSNSTLIRIGKQRVQAYIDRIDILVPFSPEAVSHLTKRISQNTLVLDHENLAKIAAGLGSRIYINSAAIGLVLGIFKIPATDYEEFLRNLFASKAKEIADKNIIAVSEGYKLANDVLSKMDITLDIPVNPEIKNEILLNGSKALALGAIAANCNFISAYPMSPSTGVLTQIANYSRDFDIVVEQAEDEIAAVNMALGAWYAGARALVTTSGGGFALMCESISLAGMTETPIVISLGQRPGPATGLPTRTEQGDLNLALYAGHGEFPRVILAPGTFLQAYNLMQKAFNLADQNQIPVIILSDQYLVDSYYHIPALNVPEKIADLNIVKTAADYKRYHITPDGISPRGIPGFGEGIVCVDSDEHTEEGYITEDFDQRNKMVQKRLIKLEALKKEAIAPEFFGNEKNEKYETLIVSWGTNYYVVKEALAVINNPNIAFLHFSQIYPLNPEIVKYFSLAKKVLVIENNATAQFAELLKKQLNVEVHTNILKYNGLPFSVEEVVSKIKENL